MKLTSADLARLKGVHPDLVAVIKRAAEITTIPFKIGEGLRTVAQQKQNVAKGVSWTMNSRHLTGHAIDLIPLVDVNNDGKVSLTEQFSWPVYYRLAPIIKSAAKQAGVAIEWGGDWKKNKDGPHWQLPWKLYPVNAVQRASGLLADPIANHPPVGEETEQAAKVKTSAAIGGTGLAGAGGIGGDQIGQVADAVSGQQFELSSGDYLRIAIAVVIIGATLYGLWKVWRK